MPLSSGLLVTAAHALSVHSRPPTGPPFSAHHIRSLSTLLASRGSRCHPLGALVECPQRLQAQRVPLPLYIAAFTSQLPCKVVSVRQSQFLRHLRSRVRAVSVSQAARLSGVALAAPTVRPRLCLCAALRCMLPP